MVPGGVAPTLVTADSKLADAANALGSSVSDCRQEFLKS
jgi:hypothetical protein